MALALRVWVAAGYAFSAWVACAFLVYAGYRLLQEPLGNAAHMAAVPLCFAPVFRLYFRGPEPLSPWAAALVALGLIALIDYWIVAPFFVRTWDFFKSFWDWQLPALLLASTVYLTGRLTVK